MNTKLIFVAVLGIAVFAGLLFWVYFQEDVQMTILPIIKQQPKDSTTTIQADLEAIDLGNLDKEFEEVDRELNSL